MNAQKPFSLVDLQSNQIKKSIDLVDCSECKNGHIYPRGLLDAKDRGKSLQELRTLTQGCYNDLKFYIEKKEAPTFGFPLVEIDEESSDGKQRGCSWEPVYKDIKRSALNNSELEVQKSIKFYSNQKIVLENKLHSVTRGKHY